MANLPRGGSTAEKLRDDIDSGRTGDKVRGSDPAAAPLGTDEEAAGTAVPAEAAMRARAAEAGGRTDESITIDRRRLRWPMIVLGVAAVCAVVWIVAVLMSGH